MVCFDICLRNSVPVIHFTTDGVHLQPLSYTQASQNFSSTLKMSEKSRELQLQIKIDTTLATKLLSITAAKSQTLFL